MTSWHERTQNEISQVSRVIAADIEKGSTPTDAINRHAHTAETYAAMLKKHGLSPVIPD